ncbi:MAG: hypothetical protein IKJ29_05205 [Akkermansia sp.]|nr:hypothetical protein [Akkermansia sp.]
MKKLCFALLSCSVPLVSAEPALPAAVSDAFETYCALPAKLIPILDKAQDKASADAAARELNNKLPAIYETRDKLHKMPKLTPAQNQAVRISYGQRMREEWAGMYSAITRVRQANCFQSVEFSKAFRLMCMMIEK